MPPLRSQASRYAAYAFLGLAVLLWLRLLRSGILAQWLRFGLYRQHGLDFADPACTTGFCDYTMFWLAGHFALQGHAALVYDHARYVAMAASILPYKTGYWPFIYPPVIFDVAVWCAWLPLALGYYLFCLVSTALAVCLLRGAKIPWWCMAAGLLSPMAMWNLYLGQLGLLCGACLVFGLCILPARPYLAGALLGLLCLKPQYALLVPFAVLAGGYWRAVLSGAGTVMLCITASFLVAGQSAWRAYWGPGRAAMAGLMDHPLGAGPEDGATSVFWMLRGLHVALPLAYGVQIGGFMLAAGWCWRLWRTAAPGRVMRTVLLSYLASPYGYNDDLAIFAVLLPMLAGWHMPWRNAALAWLYLLPAYVPRLAAATGLMPTPLFIMAVLGLALHDGSRRLGFAARHEDGTGPQEERAAGGCDHRIIGG